MKLIIIAIVGIVILEIAALMKGINGEVLRIAIALIAGLAGLATKRPKVFRE